MKLKDKVALVTGAGRGIGRAIATTFAEEGAKMVLASRTSGEIDAVAAEIEARGGHALPVRTDVSRPEEVSRMVDRAAEVFGTVDILVNNAGVQGPIGPVVDVELDRWMETVQINLIGTFLCSKAVLPGMIARRAGKIINLSGGGAVTPRPRFSAYSASKAAVVRFTETLAEEVRAFNVQVNAIAPGAVNTRMLDEVLRAGDAAGEQVIAEALRQRETGGTPTDRAASLTLFLASDDSDGLTGRLLSAMHDDWRKMAARIPELMSSPMYTMRRLDPYTLDQVKGIADCGLRIAD